MTDLKKLRDEAFEDYADGLNDKTLFYSGWDAALQTLGELAPEFDEKAARDELAKEIHRILPEVPERISATQSVDMIMRLLRWQFERDKLLIAKLKANLDFANKKADANVRIANEKMAKLEKAKAALLMISDVSDTFGRDGDVADEIIKYCDDCLKALETP